LRTCAYRGCVLFFLGGVSAVGGGISRLRTRGSFALGIALRLPFLTTTQACGFMV